MVVVNPSLSRKVYESMGSDYFQAAGVGCMDKWK
jgi:hypothetical protein